MYPKIVTAHFTPPGHRQKAPIFEDRMKINVAQQMREGIGSVRHYEINEVGENGFPTRGDLQLLRTNRSILVRGNLETTAREVCSRCLEEFDYPLSLDIEEEYFLTRDPVSGQPLDPPTESGGFIIDDNNVLDLDEAVRQYILLEQPMKPICREGCAGLCPQCGHNLNYGKCDCKQDHVDSPLDRLQELLPDKKSKGK